MTTRTHTTRLTTALSAVLAATLASCGGGSSGTSSPDLELQVVSNGFGELLPHKVFKLGSDGNPTPQLISIRTEADLLDNVRNNNPVRPVPTYGSSALLPSGAPGNHFIYARFTAPLDISSVLLDTPGGQQTGGFAGTITVVAVDPLTGESTPVKGRAFINGQTFAGTASGTPPVLPLQQWVSPGEFGGVVANVPEAVGFPGTESPFAGANELLGENAFVFVVDSDGDLSTHDTFPAGKQIRMRITNALTSSAGKKLKRQAVATTTVGDDNLKPEVVFEPPPNNFPKVTPSAGSTNVDPLTNITVEFTEAIQPLTLGDLPSSKPPTLSAAIAVRFGPQTSTVDMPFTVMPISIYDLTTYRLAPAFNFPGQGPAGAECDAFNQVNILINSDQFTDLAGNNNSLGGSSSFQTGAGPGIVNVPVTPDSVYVIRSIPEQGLSVIDLNGFGASTGNHVYTPGVFPEGNSNFPNNPNVSIQGSQLRPPLQPGTCTFDGGSAGVFTLTKDSGLNNLVVRAPIVLLPADLMLGQALDQVFNNAPSPFGCQAGGGNLCALDGQKNINIIAGGPNTITPPILNSILENVAIGGQNLASWAPHPNPPPLQFPPLCVSPFLGGKETTSIDTQTAGLSNLLVPGGNPLGQPNAPTPIPPSTLLSPEQNAWFEGPSLPQQNLAACAPYMIRQQVGQFLYMIDRARKELVVLNSNRMTVLDRIQLPDPTELAMSPNINLLAITNQNIDLVSFVDIDPSSSTFHQVVHQTVVGTRPRGIAWEPGNEDILVCNEGSDSVSILSAFSLQTRKVVASQLDRPFKVSLTPRQVQFGFLREVYFGWILNRSGRVAIFESGPSGVNGWGFDDIIGIAPQTFQNPKTMQPDHKDLRGSVWVVHEGPLNPETGAPGQLNVPALTNIVIESGLFGQLFLSSGITTPQFRDMSIGSQISLGPAALSGIPVDIAFDNMRNMSGLSNPLLSNFSAGVPAQLNGKNLVRRIAGQGGVTVNTNEPRYMFVAVPNPSTGSNGVVDVIDIGGGFVPIDTNAHQSGLQSILAPGAFLVADYFRQ